MTTNREIADEIVAKCFARSASRSEILGSLHELVMRLRSLPDPTPEPAKDLRWLVERHECLSERLMWFEKKDRVDNALPWTWMFGPIETARISDSAALTVVRGIVKAKCDEQEEPQYWDWKPNANEPWILSVWVGWGCVDEKHPTEHEAIDALLTAMKGTA